ncbi:MAG TPA: hypothetical protein DIC35_04745 [Candidatus Moranbacteria bacterium]|nr:hypothetical protein [Candidatus Moranbacteria bacterium]
MERKRIPTADYIKLIAKKLHQPFEKVALAVSYYGRDFQKIKSLLYRYAETEIITFIARVLRITKEQACLAFSCCGYDLKEIISFTSNYEYGICVNC